MKFDDKTLVSILTDAKYISEVDVKKVLQKAKQNNRSFYESVILEQVLTNDLVG
jgi:hypothetical protein